MTTWSKKLISLLCTITLACSLTPALAWGEELTDDEKGGCTTEEADGVFSEEEDMDKDAPGSSLPIIEIDTLAATPKDIWPLALDPEGHTALNPGNHERWIDRIDVPDYALEFYEVLEEAVDNDGYRDFLIDDKYFNGTVEEEGAYRADYDIPGITILKTKREDKAENAFDESCAYINDTYTAFLRDHPEVFWLKNARGFTQYGTGDYWYYVFVLKGSGFRIRENNYSTESSIKTDITKRDTIVDGIVKASEEKTTVAEKLAYFNDWLTLNNEYNTFPDLRVLESRGTYPQAWACISALDGREGEKGPVCEAYAEAFKVLCDKADIPCVLVDGIGYSGRNADAHMWNNVKVDGSWYAVDVTWNDSSKGGSGKVTGNESHDWLLLGSESRDPQGAAFSETHRTENLVMTNGAQFLNGPVLSPSAYPGYGENAAPDADDDEPTMPDDPITSEPEKALISIAKSTISVSAKTYSGKTLSPTAVTVKLGSKTLKKGTDYTVTCKGGKKVGTYTVIIKGKGAYAGTKTTTFKILPKGTSVSKLTKASKGFTVTWKKPSAAARSQIDGYQVRYATASSMKGAKTATVKGAAKTSAKVAKLKGNKTYYVQVRSYKKVSGKTYYSTWSATKSVKTKK